MQQTRPPITFQEPPGTISVLPNPFHLCTAYVIRSIWRFPSRKRNIGSSGFAAADGESSANDGQARRVTMSSQQIKFPGVGSMGNRATRLGLGFSVLRNVMPVCPWFSRAVPSMDQNADSRILESRSFHVAIWESTPRWPHLGTCPQAIHHNDSWKQTFEKPSSWWILENEKSIEIRIGCPSQRGV